MKVGEESERVDEGGSQVIWASLLVESLYRRGYEKGKDMDTYRRIISRRESTPRERIGESGFKAPSSCCRVESSREQPTKSAPRSARLALLSGTISIFSLDIDLDLEFVLVSK